MFLLTDYLILDSYYLTLKIIFFVAYMIASIGVANRGHVKFNIEYFFVNSSMSFLLFFFPLASPIIALFNDSFWLFLSITLILNIIFIIRAGKMIDITSPGNPGSIALMIPIFITLFMNPLVVVIYLIFY